MLPMNTLIKGILLLEQVGTGRCPGLGRQATVVYWQAPEGNKSEKVI